MQTTETIDMTMLPSDMITLEIMARLREAQTAQPTVPPSYQLPASGLESLRGLDTTSHILQLQQALGRPLGALSYSGLSAGAQPLSPATSVFQLASLQESVAASARLRELLLAKERAELAHALTAPSVLSSISLAQSGLPRPLTPPDAQPQPQAKPTEVPSERASLPIRQVCVTPAEASQTLTLLGATLRMKSDPFIDASKIKDPQMARGASNFFPDRLQRLLRETEENGEDDIVSFLPHGRAFLVHDIDRFLKEIAPQYFKGQTHWKSFCRQAQLYGFKRVNSGADVGAYYHELFLRGHPNLCRYMKRTGAPRSDVDRRREKFEECDDPDFYSMAPLPK